MSLKLYLVSCEMLDKQADYRSFHEKLRTLGATPVLSAQWALRSAYSAAELKNMLRGFLAYDDRITITEVGEERASYRARVDLLGL